MNEKYNMISATGDGACAFNSLVLGFCDLVLARKLDSFNNAPAYQEFIQIFCEHLNIEERSWGSVYQFIGENQDSPGGLEKCLAPVFRQLAVRCYDQLDFSAELQSEFRDYAYRRLKINIREQFGRGDIFRRHPEFLKKFAEFDKQIDALAGKTENEQKHSLAPFCLSLLGWFDQTGRHIFADKMKSLHEWAGEFELHNVCKFLNINTTIIFRGQEYYCTESYGSIPTVAFNPSQIEQLKHRGIVKYESNGDDLQLRKMTDAELDQRLCSVFDHQAIIDYLLQKQPIAGKFVPQHWHAGLVPQLLTREVITRDGDGYRFFGDINFEKVFSRISDVDEKDMVKMLWTACYQDNPVLCFGNPYGGHWYYYQLKSQAVLKLQSHVPRKNHVSFWNGYQAYSNSNHTKLIPDFFNTLTDNIKIDEKRISVIFTFDITGKERISQVEGWIRSLNHQPELLPNYKENTMEISITDRKLIYRAILAAGYQISVSPMYDCAAPSVSDFGFDFTPVLNFDDSPIGAAIEFPSFKTKDFWNFKTDINPVIYLLNNDDSNLPKIENCKTALTKLSSTVPKFSTINAADLDCLLHMANYNIPDGNLAERLQEISNKYYHLFVCLGHKTFSEDQQTMLTNCTVYNAAESLRDLIDGHISQCQPKYIELFSNASEIFFHLYTKPLDEIPLSNISLLKTDFTEAVQQQFGEEDILMLSITMFFDCFDKLLQDNCCVDEPDSKRAKHESQP